MIQSSQIDVAVVGGGAAGLLAAIAAAERGARVVVLEKNRRPGVKILISGGARCNLTNARGVHDLGVVSGPVEDFDRDEGVVGARAIQAAFGPNGAFLGPALRALTVDATIALFESEGVATKVESTGKVFPVSNKSSDVLSALTTRAARSGVVIRTNSPVERIDLDEGSEKPLFRIQTPVGEVIAGRLVLACGGRSYPGCGTTGDGYAMARALGHTIVSQTPALVPLRIESAWMHGLKGIAVEDVLVKVRSTGRIVDQRREAVLFTHFGLSGPAIMDVSGAVAADPDAAEVALELDFLPSISSDRLEKCIQDASRTGKRPAWSLIPEPIPRRLAEELVSASGVPRERSGAELGRSERQLIVAAVKGLAVPFPRTLGFEKAEVTRGGIRLEEVDPKTMESKRRPCLFLCGEILDLDGRIGGYNFQSAWSTGWLAGLSATRDP